MALLISFLIGIQLFCAVVSIPLPLFLSPSCNSLGVRTAAEVALNKLNENQKEGYILGLQRIFDVQETIEGDESAFDLVLDVLETKCHVRSRKPWRECEFRRPHETVFGHCEIIMKFNRKTNDSVLYSDNCVLRPHSRPPCPGCPVRHDPSEDDFQQAARDTLDKFNAKINHIHYFAIVEVTKASSQVVSGISKTVEFLIQETSCRKSPPMSDITQCPLLPSETAAAALCKGSVIDRGVKLLKDFSVDCDFFPHLPSANVTETPPKQKEAVVQVTNCPLSSHEVSPTFPSPQEEAKTTISPYRKGYSKSAECPGNVAKEIPGLQLPSRLQEPAETS